MHRRVPAEEVTLPKGNAHGANGGPEHVGVRNVAPVLKPGRVGEDEAPNALRARVQPVLVPPLLLAIPQEGAELAGVHRVRQKNEQIIAELERGRKLANDYRHNLIVE